MRSCASCKKEIAPGDGIEIEDELFCNLSCKDDFKGPKKVKKSTEPEPRAAEVLMAVIILALGWWMGWMFGVFPPHGSPSSSSSSSSSNRMVNTVGEWSGASSADKWGTAENYVVSSQSSIPGYEDRAKSLYTQKVRDCLDEMAARYPSSESIGSLAPICVSALPHMR